MDDLISRRAAINAIKDRYYKYGRTAKKDELIYALEKVPPVQLGTNLAEVGTEERAEERTETHACDCIDRQAALDIFDDYNVAVENGQIEAYSRDRKRLCDLPPAHPESNYDEWCTDCKEYDHENSCCHRWTKVIRQTRRELQDEFVMTAVDGTLWVTVDDVQKVGRVIVDEDKSKFCRQFYLEEEQRTGHWIPVGMVEAVGGESAQWGSAIAYHKCNECDEQALRDDFEHEVLSEWCPHCGAKMEGDAE